MNKKLVCNILLVIIVLLTICQIISFFNRTYSIIESSNHENMENIQSGPFYIRGNRYNECKCGKKVFANTCSSFPSKTGLEAKCNFDFNDAPEQWKVYHNAGANGVTSDNLWHCMSPQNILIDNSMRCTESISYNGPEGISSNLTTSLDGTMKDGAINEGLFRN